MLTKMSPQLHLESGSCLGITLFSSHKTRCCRIKRFSWVHPTNSLSLPPPSAPTQLLPLVFFGSNVCHSFDFSFSSIVSTCQIMTSDASKGMISPIRVQRSELVRKVSDLPIVVFNHSSTHSHFLLNTTPPPLPDPSGNEQKSMLLPFYVFGMCTFPQFTHI